MSTLDKIKSERLQKIEILNKNGINPYPSKTNRDISLLLYSEKFEEILSSEKEHTLSGRVMSVRGHGGSTFFDLFDGTGKLQIFLSQNEIGEDSYKLFKDTVDLGDFVEVKGKAFQTQRGEKSLSADSWTMLSKSLLPIPDQWYGIKDEDERYRKRFLDLLLNQNLREVFEKKAKFWEETRNFLKERGFLEIETPTLELTTGGAEARPFKTHHNDFDLDMYLRISVGELWQKRLMTAGFSKTFEIGRVYRNEGTSPEHLQEFTNMEFYASYMNFEDGMKLVKELYITLAKNVFGTTKFESKGYSFDFADEWEELDYVSTVEKMTGVNVLESSEKELQKKLEELGVEYEGKNKERLTDSLWKYCRKQIAGPAFLVNHPKIVAPLSKEHPDDDRLTKTFQVILAGSEVGRAHSELNDPIDQAKRFENQQKLLDSGDEEAMMPDLDYVEAMEYGMPPTFGFGVGERLFSILLGLPVRETQLFPLMRPKQ